MWRFRTTTTEDRPEEAARYWANVQPYTWNAPWSGRVAETVAAYNPQSVLEFGSSAGRNLAELRNLLPDARLKGIDINPQAVEAGRKKWGLDLDVGGEPSRLHRLRTLVGP